MKTIKHPYLIAAFVLLFCYGLYEAKSVYTQVAGWGLALLTILLGMSLWWLILPIYMLGYALQYLPYSWYSWFPLDPAAGGGSSTTSLSASTSQ